MMAVRRAGACAASLHDDGRSPSRSRRRRSLPPTSPIISGGCRRDGTQRNGAGAHGAALIAAPAPWMSADGRCASATGRSRASIRRTLRAAVSPDGGDATQTNRRTGARGMT